MGPQSPTGKDMHVPVPHPPTPHTHNLSVLFENRIDETEHKTSWS